MGDLARALIVHPNFAWKRGASDTNGNVHIREGWACQDGTLFRDKPDPEAFRIDPDDYHGPDPEEAAPPDLADPATAGALLGVLDDCAAALDGEVRTYTEDGRHVCEVVHNPCGDIERVRGTGATRGEAVAAVLLALWGAVPADRLAAVPNRGPTCRGCSGDLAGLVDAVCPACRAQLGETFAPFARPEPAPARCPRLTVEGFHAEPYTEEVYALLERRHADDGGDRWECPHCGLEFAHDGTPVGTSDDYADGHAAGDRDRFARCKEDVARALGVPGGEWGVLVERVRALAAEVPRA